MRSTSKPTVLMFPFELMSHYSRCLQLADAIKDAYNVKIAYSERYNNLIRDAGIENFPCRTFNPDLVMQCSKNFDFSWLNLAELERVFREQVHCIERLEPVAVLGDTAPTLKMAAEATGTPYISLMNGYMTKYYSVVRKIASAHPAAQFEAKLPPNIFDFMVRVGEKVAFRQVHKPFKKLRKANGLAETKMYLDELEGDQNLLCDLPSFFPQKNLPTNYHFIGPLYYQANRKEEKVVQFLNNDKPSILVSMGSTGDLSSLAFLQNSDFASYNIVVAGASNGCFKAEHILSKAFLNNTAFLERIDLVLTHGGNGSIYQALAYGVPVVCRTNIFEQEWNVQRLQQLNLGAILPDATEPRKIIEWLAAWISRKRNGEFDNLKKEISVAGTKAAFRKIWDRLLVDFSNK